jgi:DNA repair exonuclease SbcCD ATPase subunit
MIPTAFVDKDTAQLILKKYNELDEMKSDLEDIEDEIDSLEDELRDKEEAKWDLERKIKNFKSQIDDEDLTHNLPSALSGRGFQLIAYSYKLILPEKQLKLWEFDTKEVKCTKTVLLDNNLIPVLSWDGIPSLAALFEVM